MTDNTPSNPVRDINFNGKLDGQDLIRLMNAEEEQGGNRTINERVHGVLEHIGTRDIAAEWNKAVAAIASLKSIESNQDINVVTTYTSLPQTSAVTLTNKLSAEIKEASSNPKYLRDQEIAIRNNSKLNPDQREIALADAKSFVAFAKKFKDTFPQGISIDPSETIGILSHFGPLADFKGTLTIHRKPEGAKI